ncbi:MAG: MYXO-CTERM sorting domain-containing protein, partial [Candidatus Gracilibacteria bacterium]
GTVYGVRSYTAQNGHEIFEVDCSQGHVRVDFTQAEGGPRINVGECEMCVDKVVADLTEDDTPETFSGGTDDGGVVYEDGGETDTDGGVVYEDAEVETTDGGTDVYADAEVIPPNPGNGGDGCSCSVEGGDSSDPSALLIFGMAAAVGRRVRKTGKSAKKKASKKI